MSCRCGRLRSAAGWSQRARRATRVGYALEEDFAELTYDPEDFRELPDGQIVVLGMIHGRGRTSGMPVPGEFGHVWTFAEGVRGRSAPSSATLRRSRPPVAMESVLDGLETAC
jgi:hypothetical protein